MMNINDIFGENGVIAKHLKTYEFRPQQMIMANAVGSAIELNKHLLAEAGTGVGKSLAYLVPFIKWSKDFSKKIVISTYTKTLQEQLVNKDLPFLRTALNIDFRFALCVGAHNYLCLRRLNRGYNYDLFDTNREVEEIRRITEWKNKTESGLYSDLEFEPIAATWNKVCREGDLCLGKKCLYRKDCFYNKAKLIQDKADILVINHHLFFANLISGGNVLPNFEAVVFDEAHTLENVATEYLGIEISNFKIDYFLDSIYNPKSGQGFLKVIRKISEEKADNIKESIYKLRTTSDLFFSELISKFGEESKVQRIRTRGFISNYLKEPMKELILLLGKALDDAKELEDKIEIKSFILQAQAINSGLSAIISQYPGEHRSLDDNVYPIEDIDSEPNEPESADWVWWIEILARVRRPKYSLYGAPIDISDAFKQMILDTIKPIIFTSATLSTNGNFDFIKQSLGIENAEELILTSPFDYTQQVLVYIPKTLPDPKINFELYQKEAINEIERIINIMQGRTFVLFTNYKMLDMANTILQEKFDDFNIFKQGDAPRYKLLERFKNSNKSVLLGTNTFWQGVDVPGKALECVIITKLPFAVPDEPIIEAKMELLTAQGKNPFLYYQIPQAIIMFRQGFGRLIRRKSDIGMVAILDPRIKTRFYGKSFLESLPECRQVDKLEDVEKFFLDTEKERKTEEVYESRNT